MKYIFYFSIVGGSTLYLNGNEYNVTEEEKEAYIYETKDPDRLHGIIQNSFWSQWFQNKDQNIQDPKWGPGDVELCYKELK